MSQPRQPRRISAQEALAILQSMSDGGDVDLAFQNENVVTDSSSDEDVTAPKMHQETGGQVCD